VRAIHQIVAGIDPTSERVIRFAPTSNCLPELPPPGPTQNKKRPPFKHVTDLEFLGYKIFKTFPSRFTIGYHASFQNSADDFFR
jgi:hypothetical protein